VSLALQIPRRDLLVLEVPLDEVTLLNVNFILETLESLELVKNTRFFLNLVQGDVFGRFLVSCVVVFASTCVNLAFLKTIFLKWVEHIIIVVFVGIAHQASILAKEKLHDEAFEALARCRQKGCFGELLDLVAHLLVDID